MTLLHAWYWLRHALGIDTQQSMAYAFWSGFGPALIALALGSGTIAAVLHRFNCHQHRCWRIGRHHAGPYVVCRRHSPDPAVREGLRAHHIHAAHRRRLERQG